MVSVLHAALSPGGVYTCVCVCMCIYLCVCVSMCVGNPACRRISYTLLLWNTTQSKPRAGMCFLKGVFCFPDGVSWRIWFISHTVPPVRRTVHIGTLIEGFALCPAHAGSQHEQVFNKTLVRMCYSLKSCLKGNRAAASNFSLCCPHNEIQSHPLK